MRRSIATVSLSGSLHQKLQAVAAAGFDGFELFENDFIHSDLTARALRPVCADLNLSVELYQPLRDVEGMPDAQFRRALERARHKLDLMAEIGCPLMLVCSNTSPVALPDPDRAAEQLHALADLAAGRGLRIGYEALAWGRHVDRYAQAWDIVQRAAHPQLGLILDSFHTLALRDDPAGIARIPGERIFFVQMADAPWLGMDVLQWARHFRNFPGQGQLDVSGFFEHVLRAGYRGVLSLEIFNDVFRQTPNRRTATDAMRSLLFLESEVRRRMQARDGEVPRGVALFDPPDMPAITQVAFVEFAVDDDTEPRLLAWLGALGFTVRARHRTKRVTLLAQGGIRLLVNAQPGSVARQRFATAGVGVCALGLATPEPQRAQSRGIALRSARVDNPRGAGEMALPSIMAPGGTVIQFVPSAGGPLFEDIDFEAVAPDATPDDGAGLVDVDHLSVALGEDELDTWTLFGRAVLGLQTGREALDVADPYGLVRSHTMADVTRRLRIVMDVSLGQDTSTARVVAATRGAGIQGLSLRARDVLASARVLRARGVPFIDVSPNYYDDLRARTDLPAAQIDAMQQAGVLYDEDARGSFLQLVTRRFAGRFFVQIVQRLDDYDGYGLVNGAVRMAAEFREAGRPLTALHRPIDPR